MDFPSVARRHLDPLLSRVDLRPCPDQYVGEVATMLSIKKFPVRQPASQRPQNKCCVLLILESPHTSEFKGDPAPAKGSTGISIATRLTSVRGLGLDSVGSFGLLLLNAVQYQCSLGLPTSVARDNVFLEMWRMGGRNDFTARLKELFLPGDIVVNSCTKGNARKSTDQLRVHVQRAIESAELGALALRRTHPSSWRSKLNRDYEWPNA